MREDRFAKENSEIIFNPSVNLVFRLISLIGSASDVGLTPDRSPPDDTHNTIRFRGLPTKRRRNRKGRRRRARRQSGERRKPDRAKEEGGEIGKKEESEEEEEDPEYHYEDEGHDYDMLSEESDLDVSDETNVDPSSSSSSATREALDNVDEEGGDGDGVGVGDVKPVGNSTKVGSYRNLMPPAFHQRYPVYNGAGMKYWKLREGYSNISYFFSRAFPTFTSRSSSSTFASR